MSIVYSYSVIYDAFFLFLLCLLCFFLHNSFVGLVDSSRFNVSCTVTVLLHSHVDITHIFYLYRIDTSLMDLPDNIS